MSNIEFLNRLKDEIKKHYSHLTKITGKLDEVIEKYKYLEKRDMKLSALEEAGVDNWEGYPHAMEILNKD